MRAATQEAQYTHLIAEKELEHRMGDAEAERIPQQEKARYQKELKILGADKKDAVANAKLKVFKEALLEQELGRDSELPSLAQHEISNLQLLEQELGRDSELPSLAQHEISNLQLRKDIVKKA